MVKAHSYLNKIANYIPGTSKIKGAEKIIKLSSNENALECSNKAMDTSGFNRLIEVLRGATPRSEIILEEVPPPQK